MNIIDSITNKNSIHPQWGNEPLNPPGTLEATQRDKMEKVGMKIFDKRSNMFDV